MEIETGRRKQGRILESREAMLEYLQAVLEDGDPEVIAPALNEVARARGLALDALTAQSDIASVIGTLKAVGLELTVKAA